MTVPAEYSPDTPAPEKPVETEDAGGGDLDARIAEQQEADRREKEALAAKSAAVDAKLEQLEKLLQDQFSRKTPPVGQGPSAPSAPPITDEDFMHPSDARKAAERMAREAALEVGQQLDDNYRGAMATVLEGQFENKLEKMKQQKYWKYVEADIMGAIKKNENLRLTPKALDVLYRAAVGDKAEEIYTKEREAELELERQNAPLPKARPRVGSSRARPAAPSGPAPSRDEDEVELDPDAEAVRSTFAPFIAAMGGDLSADRFAESLAQRSRSGNIPDYREER